MHELLQQLINGLHLGATYALIALGYSMVYGVLRLINFAHGDVFMLGAYAGLFTATAFGLTMHYGWGVVLLLILAVTIAVFVSHMI